MRKFMLGLKVVLFVVLFAPSLSGCIYVEFPVNPFDLGLDGGIGGLNGLGDLLNNRLDATAADQQDATADDLDATPTMDAGGSVPDMDAGALPSIDGSATSLDSSVARTSLDGGVTTGGSTFRPTVVQAVSLAATACSGRRLTNPADWMAAAHAAHMRLWHVCYRTPTALTAGTSSIVARPDSVSIHWYNRLTGMTELARVAAPRVADPWTANFLIALPEGTPPVFNVSNNYPASQIYALRSNNEAQPLDITGTLQLWEVGDGGLQTERLPRPYCRDPHRTTGVNTFFWTDVIHCDGLDSSCNDLFLFYQCRIPS